MSKQTSALDDEESPTVGRWSFAFSYVAWVVILSATVITLWWSSAELSAFRYAGF